MQSACTLLTGDSPSHCNLTSHSNGCRSWTWSTGDSLGSSLQHPRYVVLGKWLPVPMPTFPFLCAALSSVSEYLISFCSDRPWLSCPRHKQEHGLLHPGVLAVSSFGSPMARRRRPRTSRKLSWWAGLLTYPQQCLLPCVSCCFSQQISKVSKTCKNEYLKMIRKDCKLDIRSIFVIRNAEQHFWSRNISLLAVRLSI